MAATYRCDIVVCELPDQGTHGVDVVIHAFQEHTLVAHSDASFKEALSGILGDPRDFVGMIEMSVQRHRLSLSLRSIGNVLQRRNPLILGVEDTTWRDSQALGGKAETTDMRDLKKALADHVNMVGLQIVRVATRNYDILKLRSLLDVVEDFVPATASGLEGSLSNLLRIGTNTVSSSTVAAVSWANGGCYQI